MKSIAARICEKRNGRRKIQASVLPVRVTVVPMLSKNARTPSSTRAKGLYPAGLSSAATPRSLYHGAPAWEGRRGAIPIDRADELAAALAGRLDLGLPPALPERQV